MLEKKLVFDENVYLSTTMISVWSCIPLLLIALHCLEERGRRAEMRLVTCYNGKDKSGQDGTIINVQ